MHGSSPGADLENLRPRVIAGVMVVPQVFQTTQADLDALTELVRSIQVEGPLRIVEIGSWIGESALNFIQALGNRAGVVHCIDPWRHRNVYGHFLGNVSAYATGIRRIEPLRALSVRAAPRFADGSLDLVFIDGDHGYESVRTDIYCWQHKLKPGGILCGHDYDEVRQAVTDAGLTIKRVGNSVWVAC